MEPVAIKSTILSHPTFAEFRDGVLKTFRKWRQKYAPKLEAFGKKDHPKTLIHEMSEELLTMFLKTPLLDGYDIYQHLMSYCDEVLQDDLSMVFADGWKVAGQLRRIQKSDNENASKEEKADITVGRIKYRSELIPPDLVIERYFKKDRDEIADHVAKLESIEQQSKEMVEENAGEDGLFGNVIDESGKIKKGTIKTRMKEIENDPDSEEEYKALDVYMRTDEMAQVNGKVLRAMEQTLAENLLQKYPKLTEAEIKTLLVEDKWMATLETAIRTELDRLSQRLTGRVKTLADRYETPLSELEAQAAELAKRVKKHLAKIGSATAQQLLSGKKRLPGSEGEWEEKSLGKIACIQRGASPRPIDSPVWFSESSSIGWVRISDVSESNGRELFETKDYLSEKGVMQSRFIPAGTLIMSICASVGVPIITGIDTCIHDGFVSFLNIQYLDQWFLFYKLKELEQGFKSMGQTGSQSNLNTDIVKNCSIMFPINISEQQAIASILSDMDAEIATLEKLRAKRAAIKQGMMQELLTGRTRLI